MSSRNGAELPELVRQVLYRQPLSRTMKAFLWKHLTLGTVWHSCVALHFSDCCLGRKETTQLPMEVSAEAPCQLTGRILSAESGQHKRLLFFCGIQL